MTLVHLDSPPALPAPEPPDLETAAIAAAGLDELNAARTREERTQIIGDTILAVFDHYYYRSRRIPYSAKRAYEARNWPEMAQLSRDRLAIYSRSLDTFAPMLRSAFPQVPDVRGLWVEIEARVLDAIRGRYEADLAFAYLRSVRRAVQPGEWTPVAYAGSGIRASTPPAKSEICRRFSCAFPADVDTVLAILELVPFAVPFRDLPADAELAATEINAALTAQGLTAGAGVTIDMVDAGFFRNRGCYLIGRIEAGGVTLPIGIALLNEPSGMVVDAVLLDSDDLQFVFSSTLANFHVTGERYHALAHFLWALMPKRPLGLHYSTIGFNHVGKVAVMADLRHELSNARDRLDFAVGFRGTVAIGFSVPSSHYVLKVIRNQPTANYKWEKFPGVAAVLEKYRIVHESDRAGSMLDNVILDTVRFESSWFAPELLEELATAASGAVTVTGDSVMFAHLIVQIKMVPVPEFHKTAAPDAARDVLINLGNCIRNNAAANIFNRDLDARNYGVSPIGKVYLFDYDAVEPLTGVKFRTNAGRFDGEEDLPDWFFETGTVFLPEELLTGLRIDDPGLRRFFREVNGDLMTLDYWDGMQRALLRGLVPKVLAYPVSKRLKRPVRPA